MNGLGKSAKVIFRKVPGLTPLDVTMADRPVRIFDGMASPGINLVTPTDMSRAKEAASGWRIVFMICQSIEPGLE